MKIDARRLPPILRDIGRVAVVLLHGDDPGLVRALARQAVAAEAGAASDPFRITELDGDDAGGVAEALSSPSLIGGRRVVRVSGAGDRLAPVVAAATPAALLVLEAGELPAKSKLRAAAERGADCYAVACYAQAGAGSEAVVRAAMQAGGVAADADAVAWLAGQGWSGQETVASEAAKAALFVGAGGRLTLEAARLACEDVASGKLETCLFAATSGDIPGTDRALAQAAGEGVNAVALLRSAILHLQRLRGASLAVARGSAPADAVRLLRPPVFFRHEPAFLRAVQLWSPAALDAALATVWRAERSCKATGSPADLLCAQAVTWLAREAARLARRSGSRAGESAMRG